MRTAGESQSLATPTSGELPGPDWNLLTWKCLTGHLLSSGEAHSPCLTVTVVEKPDPLFSSWDDFVVLFMLYSSLWDQAEEGQPLKSHLDSFFPLPSPASFTVLQLSPESISFINQNLSQIPYRENLTEVPLQPFPPPTQVYLSMKTTSSECDFGGCWKEP